MQRPQYLPQTSPRHPAVMRSQQRQPIQRPRTANNERFLVTTPSADATYNVTDKVGNANLVSSRQKVPVQTVAAPPRFARSDSHQQRSAAQQMDQKTRLAQHAMLSGRQSHPPSAKVSATPLAPRYEESRTSAAAKNIALNFQTSMSSDLTIDKTKDFEYSGYADNTASGLGFMNQQDTKNQEVAKSVSQIKTNPTEQPSSKITGRIIDLCGDGHDAVAQQPPICSYVIDQAVGLEKSKKMIVNLIDSAIEQLKTRESASKQSLLRMGDGVSVSVSTSTEEDKPRSSTKRMKMECISKLEAELTRLRVLEEFNEYE